jgi:O-antigen ligase
VIWEIIWQRFLEQPWLGWGAGSSGAYLAEHFGTITHPHNDFLRVLHDLGITGLVLWALWATSLVALLRRAARSEAGRAYAAAGCGLFIAMLACALTDNVVNYIFVMAPAGAVLGMAASGSLYPTTEPAARVSNCEKDPRRTHV